MKRLASLALFTVLVALPAHAALSPTPAERFADLTKRAAAGDTQAQAQLGWVYMNGSLNQRKDEAQGAQWIAKAAAGGDAQSQYDLAQFYRTGRGVNPDFQQALDWTQKAADQGKPEAVSSICVAYTQDPTVKADWSKALPYCNTAAKDGDLRAVYALGAAYADGLGVVTPDATIALQDLNFAADKGIGLAQQKLGDIYAEGTLVPADPAQAFANYARAARAGLPHSIAAMAHAYDSGAGVDADPSEAARLYGILADQGDADAKTWLGQHPDARAPQVITLNDIPRDTIFYAVDGADPRFVTQDISGYFETLMENSYPVAAQESRAEGEANVECRFTPAGDFDDCILIDESPKGMGFGAALMYAANRLQFSGNKTDWQGRYAGKVLRLHARWKP
jgi:TPR repeat protein